MDMTRFISNAASFFTFIDGKAYKFKQHIYMANEKDAAILKGNPQYLTNYYTDEDAKAGRIVHEVNGVTAHSLSNEAMASSYSEEFQMRMASLQNELNRAKETIQTLVIENDHLKKELLAANVLQDASTEVQDFTEVDSTVSYEDVHEVIPDGD